MSMLGFKGSSVSGGEGTEKVSDRLKKNWQLLFMLSFIVIVSFILRTFFAYEYAVAGGYALSGGSGASYHLRVIEYLLNNGSILIDDWSLNYPLGEQNINPLLMDGTVAVIAWIVTLFGVSATAAASGTLVFSTAILGAITCIPVYYLGKEMFGHTAGIISSLLYGVSAATISNTVLSNGTEAAFYGFFFVLMIYFMVKSMKANTNESFARDKVSLSYVRSIYSKNKRSLKYAVYAGIMFALVALTWNGFRPIVIMLAALMIVQAIIDRIRDKDPTPTVSLYAVTLLVGMIIALPVYLLQGLWELVFSGSFLLSIIAVVVALLISETKRHPWLLSVPVILIATAVFFLVLFFVSPGTFSNIVSGNSLYTDPTYISLIELNSVVTLSIMAGYYGWMTMWLPYILAALLIYGIREKLGNTTYMFTVMWIVAMMAISWSSNSLTFIAAPAYAVGAGAILAKILFKANIKEYFAGFKGTGFHFKTTIKKLIKPTPLFTILMAIFLVGAPNAIYAIDSSISSNERSDGNVNNYFGAFSYSVRNNDGWKVNDAWNTLSDLEKSGALVTWWDYSNDAARLGGFEIVSGTGGAGAVASSNILLANGSKEATAAMAIRLLDAYGIDAFKDTFDSLSKMPSSFSFDELRSIMNNPEAWISVILKDPNTYGNFSSSLTAENAMYIAAIHYLCETAGLTETRIIEMYDAICAKCGSSINYIAVSPSMFPIGYGDGTMFSTLAYMNNYTLDTYSAPTEFYSFDYYGYASYTEEMYNSVLWRTYIGPSPSDYGYSSAVDMLNAFTLSTGEANTIPQPGYGMANYKIVYWKVSYNPDSNATLDSDGWVTMDALGDDGAIAKQKEDGGLINYLAGYTIVLEYVPSTSATLLEGTVLDDSGNPVEGVRVSLVDEDEFQKTIVFTDEDGKFEMYILDVYSDGTIVYALGTTNWSGGLEGDPIKVSDVLSVAVDGVSIYTITIDTIRFQFKLFEDDSYEKQIVNENLTATVTGTTHGRTQEFYMVNGVFIAVKGPSDPSDHDDPDDPYYDYEYEPLVPDTYTITVKDGDTTLLTQTYQPMFAESTIRQNLSLSSATISVDIKDGYGSQLETDPDVDYVMLTNNDDNTYWRVISLEDGKGEVKLMAGTYTATLVKYDGSGDVDDLASYSATDLELFNAVVTVTSGSTETLSVRAQYYATIVISNSNTQTIELRVMNTVFSTFLDPSVTSIKVPVGIGGNDYTVYAVYVSGGVRYFTYETVSVTQGSTVTATLGSGVQAYEFSKILTTTTGSTVSGTVDIYLETGELLMTITAESDGVFGTYLPTGTYTIHAYNSDSSNKLAYLEKLTIGGNDTTGTLVLEEARSVTVEVLVSNDGTGKIPMVSVEIYLNDKGIQMNVTTDNDGTYSRYMPISSNPTSTYTFKTAASITSGSYTYTFTGTVSGGKVTAQVTSAMSAVTGTFRTQTPTYGGNILIIDQNDAPVDTELSQAETDVEDSKIIEIKRTALGEYQKYDTDNEGYIVDSNGNRVNFAVGAYDIRIQREVSGVATGYYYSGTLTVTISGDVTVTVKKMTKLELTELQSNDVVTVNDLDGGTSLGENSSWYFEAGKEYQLKVTDSAGEKIWYLYVTDVTLATLKNSDLGVEAGHAVAEVALSESVEIKGYVGYAGSGKVYINYGSEDQTYVATVTNGRYTATIPDIEGVTYTFAVYLGYDEDTDSYAYSNVENGVPQKSIDSIPDSKTVNMTVIGRPITEDDDDTNTLEVSDENWTLTDIEETEVENEDGDMETVVYYNVTFELTLTTEFASIFLSGGSGWDEIKFLNSNGDEITYVNNPTIDDNDPTVVIVPTEVTVTVEAKFNKDVDPSLLTILLKDVSGKTIQTYTVTMGSLVVDTSDGELPTTDVVVSRGSSDRISNSESNLAIVLKNNSFETKWFTVSVFDGTNGDNLNDNWYYVITDSKGTILAHDGEMFELAPLTELTVYIKIVAKEDDRSPLPDAFDVKVSVYDDENGTPTSDVSAGEEAILDTVTVGLVIVSVQAHQVELTSESGSASGPNVFNTSGEVPVTLWVLVAMVLLLFVLIVWLGMKRGVFARKR